MGTNVLADLWDAVEEMGKGKRGKVAGCNSDCTSAKHTCGRKVATAVSAGGASAKREGVGAGDFAQNNNPYSTENRAGKSTAASGDATPDVSSRIVTYSHDNTCDKNSHEKIEIGSKNSPVWVDDPAWLDALRERASLKRAIGILSDRLEDLDGRLKTECGARPGLAIHTSQGTCRLSVEDRSYKAQAARVVTCRTLRSEVVASDEGAALALIGAVASVVGEKKR